MTFEYLCPLCSRATLRYPHCDSCAASLAAALEPSGSAAPGHCRCVEHHKAGCGYLVAIRQGNWAVLFDSDFSWPRSFIRIIKGTLPRSTKHSTMCRRHFVVVSIDWKNRCAQLDDYREPQYRPVVDTGTLFRVVRDLVRRPAAQPIASSSDVKKELDREGIVWDMDGRSGGLLEKADRHVAKDRRLRRWKRGPSPTDHVGWSLSAHHDPEQHARAEEWARENGWHPDTKV